MGRTRLAAARAAVLGAGGLIAAAAASVFVAPSCVEGGGSEGGRTDASTDARVDGGGGDGGADGVIGPDGPIFDGEDPDAGCSPSCAPGESCLGGTCACAGTKCGSECVDVAGDPRNCGACGVVCSDDQYCRLDAGPNCKCRPPAVACSGACTDRTSDPRACGACDTVCPVACAKGACVAACPADLVGCAKGGGKIACVSTATDPANCGACGRVCGNDEVCVAGACAHYRPAVGCATCPCAVCATLLAPPSSCCPPLTGQPSSICVAASACP